MGLDDLPAVMIVRSSDGKDFSISREALLHMGTVREMLELVQISATDAIPIPNVAADILKIVVQFCELHKDEPQHYAPYERTNTPYIRDPCDIELFADRSDRERTHLLNAANFLNFPRLCDAVLAETAVLLDGLTVNEIRQRLNIVNDFTPEEEARNHRDFPFYNL